MLPAAPFDGAAHPASVAWQQRVAAIALDPMEQASPESRIAAASRPSVR
jgi:hypothetical protein